MFIFHLWNQPDIVIYVDDQHALVRILLPVGMSAIIKQVAGRDCEQAFLEGNTPFLHQ